MAIASSSQVQRDSIDLELAQLSLKQTLKQCLLYR